MAKHGGAFKSEKRKKELTRQKKQEEKRQRRLNKGVTPEAENQDTEPTGDENSAETEDSGTAQDKPHQ